MLNPQDHMELGMVVHTCNTASTKVWEQKREKFKVISKQNKSRMKTVKRTYTFDSEETA